MLGTNLAEARAIQFFNKAADAKLLKTSIKPDFLVLQIELSFKGLLDQVTKQQMSLQDGEKNLKLAFEFLSTSYFGQLPNVADVENLSKRIVNEYYDTYSLL